MTSFVFADNARSTLGTGINASVTTLTLAPGGGARFPVLGPGQVFALTLNDVATQSLYEVCYCTARSGDVMTIVRGQEGTAPRSWLIGDFAFNGPTRGQMAAMVQASGAPIYAVAGGTANALTAAIGAVNSLDAGMAVRVKATAANTAAVTLNVSALGAKSLLLSGGSPLAAGAVLAGSIFEAVYDGTNFQLMGAEAPRGFQAFLSSGTFTVPLGVTRVRVRVLGGGGGGGGSTIDPWAAGGGGAGGFAEGRFSVVPGSTVAVTVGPGGIGSPLAGFPGAAGFTSSFGAFCSATGGGGGGRGGDQGGAGGISIGGMVDGTGAPGLPGCLGMAGALLGGTGGSSAYGGGGIETPSTGANASGRGAGGSGGGGFGNAGGAGTGGMVIVEW